MTTLPISNLPTNDKPVDSASDAKKFFNSYYSKGISIPADVLDSSISFFRKRGFEDTAAITVSTVLLSQAKIENVSINKILDTLQGLDQIQLSRVVQEILNYNRLKISTLGTKVDNTSQYDYEKRNIII